MPKKSSLPNEGLGEGYDRDITFASALEAFGGGHNDLISVPFRGPVMTKFTIALREIGTYKEVEHVLNDILLQNNVQCVGVMNFNISTDYGSAKVEINGGGDIYTEQRPVEDVRNCCLELFSPF
ncbi:hypothetical protein L484_017155 [Morus notabilis]|uniref:Uncharacterized protein n=1 Tax=Morus notabilis TaxID=981085 RepID=W9QL40_9ROSA|nr:hypothetical protein L484_017155 [Morus notabilis]